MNRRDFFTSLLKATAAAAVAYSFPSIIVPKNIVRVVTFPMQPTGQDYWSIGIRGLPYVINNRGDYFGLARSGIYLPTPEWLARH